MSLSAALMALAELADDKEFAQTLFDINPAYRDGAGRVTKYLLSRGVDQRLAMLLSIAYSAGCQHALDWAGRAIDRAEGATKHD